jgi:hypothetical protein
MTERTAISERILFLIGKLNLNPNSFSVKAGLKAPTTNKIIKGENLPGYSYLEKVLSAYTDISAEYLMRGEGCPLLSEDTNNEQTISNMEILALNENVSALRRLNDIYQDKINTLSMEIAELKRINKSLEQKTK